MCIVLLWECMFLFFNMCFIMFGFVYGIRWKWIFLYLLFSIIGLYGNWNWFIICNFCFFIKLFLKWIWFGLLWLLVIVIIGVCKLIIIFCSILFNKFIVFVGGIVWLYKFFVIIIVFGFFFLIVCINWFNIIFWFLVIYMLWISFFKC